MSWGKFFCPEFTQKTEVIAMLKYKVALLLALICGPYILYHGSTTAGAYTGSAANASARNLQAVPDLSGQSNA